MGYKRLSASSGSGCLMLAIIGVLAGYVGGFIAFLSPRIGTCTQNVADELTALAFAVPFYVVTAICVGTIKNRGTALTVCFVLVPVLLWQAIFAIEFSVRVVLFGASACEVLQGAPYGMDGNELGYVALWLSVSLGLPFVLAFLLRRRF